MTTIKSGLKPTNNRESKESSARFLQSFSNEKELWKKAHSEYFQYRDELISIYGTKQAVKMLKDINGQCRHFAVGHPKVTTTIGGIWSRKDKQFNGIPKRLGSLIKLITLEPNIGLFIPNTVYTMYLEPDLNIDTVIEVSKANLTKEKLDSFRNFCRRRCPELKPSKVECNISLKAGPCGPAAISQMQDAVALSLDSVVGNYRYPDFVRAIYGPNSWLEECWRKVYDHIVDPNTDLSDLIWPRRENKIVVAKMEFIPGPAGKTRIIYIFNWWLQTLLLPLHDSMMLSFKRMKGDSTWDQSKGVDIIREWSAEGSQLYSYDLTAATDRWPVEHQKCVIDACFGESIGNIWFTLMTSYAPYCEKRRKHVKYEVGQAMGAYTSWSTLNMSHHMVIRYLAKENRVKSDYVVLGDDIVIKGKILAEAYENYMVNTLGVKINKSKSITSEEGKPSSAEFARNLVRDGRVIGTISPNLLQSIFNGEDHMSIELVRECREKLGLVTYVTNSETLLPKPLHTLLSNKTKNNMILILSIPVGLIQPVTRVMEKDEIAGFNPDNYVSYPNPWAGIDKDLIQYSIDSKFGVMAGKRCQELETLVLSLQTGKTSAIGYHLESKVHPIEYMLKNLKNDVLSAAMGFAMGAGNSAIPPNVLTTSIDMLIEVFTKGVNYRQWRDSKSLKIKKITSFINDIHYSTSRGESPLAESEFLW